jgi:rhodanese-related sulfurtransferase
MENKDISMKPFGLRSLLLSFFLGLALIPSDAAADVAVLAPQDYITARLKGEPILLLDVRPVREEFEEGHIPGALHVSINDLDRTTLNLLPNQKIVVTCGCCKWAVCPNARPAVEKLIQRGFTNVSALRLEDGIASWAATPLEKGAGLSIPNVVVPTAAAQARGRSNFTLTLINPTTTPFPEDVTNFTRYMTQALPQLRIKTVSSRSAEGRRLIQEMNIQALPVALLDASFRNAALFSQWSNAVWVKEVPGARGFLVTSAALPPQIYMNRPKKANELDLFIMSQCPFGIGALNQTLQAIQDKKVASDVKLSVHYLVNRVPGTNGSNPRNGETRAGPPAELKGDPTAHFQSLHGVSELEENVRELVILKYFPDQFPAYFLERSKQPTSSLWENPAVAAGLDPAFIAKKYVEEGAALLQKEYELSDEMGISSSPTFLWENTIRINNVAHLKTFPPLKNLDIKLSGSCNHPK